MVTAAVVTAAVVTAAVVLSSTSDEADGTATTAGMFFCGFCCFLGFLARGGENDPRAGSASFLVLLLGLRAFFVGCSGIDNVTTGLGALKVENVVQLLGWMSCCCWETSRTVRF